MKNRGFSVFLIVCAFALSSCAGTSSKLAERPEYQQGYGDGCATASGRTRDLPGPVTRDAHLYDTNDAYRAGWRAGFNSCSPMPSDPLGR